MDTFLWKFLEGDRGYGGQSINFWIAVCFRKSEILRPFFIFLFRAKTKIITLSERYTCVVSMAFVVVSYWSEGHRKLPSFVRFLAEFYQNSWTDRSGFGSAGLTVSLHACITNSFQNACRNAVHPCPLEFTNWADSIHLTSTVDDVWLQKNRLLHLYVDNYM